VIQLSNLQFQLIVLLGLLHLQKQFIPFLASVHFGTANKEVRQEVLSQQ
jgi:hypothetical protein